MAISPIMGIGSYGSVSSIQPMNYAVENDADFSDVYNAESTKQTAGVNGAAPVQYPNAMVRQVSNDAAVDPMEKLEKNQQVSSQYNQIADKFTNHNTGYSKMGMGNGYSTVGSSLDLYA